MPDQLKGLKRQSVKFRLIASVAVVMTLIVMLSLVWSIYRTQKQDFADLKRHGELITEIQANAIAAPMWDLNFNNIDTMITAMGEDRDFRLATVIDADGNEISSYGERSYAPTDLIFTQNISYDFNGESQKIGKLKLVLKQDSLVEKTRNHVISVVIAFLLLLGATILTVYVALATIVTKPMARMTGVMKKMAEGDLNHEVPVKRRDEFGTMASTFNIMTKKLRDNYRTIEERTIALEKARQEAVAANQTKSEFVATMSHELRTPLNAIIGYGEMLVEEAPKLESKDFVPELLRIVSSAKHLLELINEILDFSKIEAGKVTIDLTTFNLKQVISDVESIAIPLMEKGNNYFEIIYDENIPEMTSDATKIRQNLINLIGNSAKFTKKGNITLAVTKESIKGEAFVLFSVTDTGIGMSEEQVSKVFNAFTQADTSTTRKYGGTGLGLSITKSNCDFLSGQIDVQSTLGKGSTFLMRLPLVVQTSCSVKQLGDAS